MPALSLLTPLSNSFKEMNYRDNSCPDRGYATSVLPPQSPPLFFLSDLLLYSLQEVPEPYMTKEI